MTCNKCFYELTSFAVLGFNESYKNYLMGKMGVAGNQVFIPDIQNALAIV